MTTRRASRSIDSISPTCTLAGAKMRRTGLSMFLGADPPGDHLADEAVEGVEVLAADHGDVAAARAAPPSRSSRVSVIGT